MLSQKYKAIGITEELLLSESIDEHYLDFIASEAGDIVSRRLPIGCGLSSLYYERISKPVGKLPAGVANSHRIKITLNVNIPIGSKIRKEKHMEICAELNGSFLFYNNKNAVSKIGYKINYKNK